MDFFKKIFSHICLTISLLFLFYTYYRSEIYWEGIKRDDYIIRYITSTILIFFSIITFFITQKIKEYLIISSLSIFLSIYLFEGYLTYKDYKKVKFSKEEFYESRTGKKWDHRSKFKVYEDLKKISVKTSVSIFPSIYLNQNNKIYPLSGVSHSKTVNCQENGYFSIFKSDRYGFNNPDQEWDSKEIEYLLVGDSFAFGDCVNRPYDISSILRTLSKKSVLNISYSDNGPLLSFASLREYLSPNVKKILWVFTELNDIYDLNNEIKNLTLKKYLEKPNFTQKLKFKQKEIDDLANDMIEKEKLNAEKKEKLKTEKKEKLKAEKKEKEYLIVRFINFLKINRLRASIFYKFDPSIKYIKSTQTLKKLNPQPEFKHILKLVKDLSNKNNSKLYFVYMPEYSRYNFKYDDTSYNLVRNILNELDIPLIDIHKEVFLKEKNPLELFPFGLDGHYNQNGYKKVANVIYKLTK